MSHPNAFRFEEHPEARRFPPVDTAKLADVAKRYDFDFCADYLAFLDQYNGYDFDSVETHFPPPDQYRSIELVRYLFGIGTGFEYNDLSVWVDACAAGLGRAYLKFCYPIGEGAGGNAIVQIQKGALRGQIMLIDHETHLHPDEFERTYQRSFDDFDPDILIPWLCDQAESFVPLGSSFTAFVDGLLVMRRRGGTVNVAAVATS